MQSREGGGALEGGWRVPFWQQPSGPAKVEAELVALGRSNGVKDKVARTEPAAGPWPFLSQSLFATDLTDKEST